MAKKTIVNKELKNRYRLLVMNDETFEEKVSLTLTPANVWIAGSTVSVVLILLTALAIIYTPLKYFIPGFSGYTNKNQLVKLQIKTDSLEQVIAYRNRWLENVNMVLSGEGDSVIYKKTGSPTKAGKSDASLDKVSKAEQNLRRKVEEDENFSVSLGTKNISPEIESIKTMYFVPPVLGHISQEYDLKTEHYGIDVATPKDEPVKSVANGTVISASWTLDNGHEITVQHDNELVTVYKHNSRLLKKSGNFVRAGEVIAIAGNSGENSTGTHLHFEMWLKGKSVNPKNLINF